MDTDLKANEGILETLGHMYMQCFCIVGGDLKVTGRGVLSVYFKNKHLNPFGFWQTDT